jgi:peroxiredoxin
VKVARSADRLAAADATAVFVVHDTAARVRELMLHDVDSPFPVLVDADRSAYDAWGMHRASLATIWLDPNVWRQYAALLRSGAAFRGLGADVRQMGGDFVVDRGGRVVYARPQQKDDRPPVGPLVRLLTDGG